MASDDWFRNEDWDAATEARFRAKLARSRTSRPQYLRIQAGYLTQSHPQVALELIDEYFNTGDGFDVQMAHWTRAEAYRYLGKVDEAVASYKEALSWEQSHPGQFSPARSDFPKYVAEHRLSEEYDYALDILLNRFRSEDHQFPLIAYHWNGSHALILSELGNNAEAREFAERALRAAAKTESPFRYHRSVGIVHGATDDFATRIKRIARPSSLRSLSRVKTSDH
jgi:tetratricopeptide (TPR) repeat protein